MRCTNVVPDRAHPTMNRYGFMAEALHLPRDELPICHALHKFIKRLNTRYRFWEFTLTGLSVPIHENGLKPRGNRSTRIIHEGIANHEDLARGCHSRNPEEF